MSDTSAKMSQKERFLLSHWLLENKNRIQEQALCAKEVLDLATADKELREKIQYPITARHIRDMARMVDIELRRSSVRKSKIDRVGLLARHILKTQEILSSLLVVMDTECVTDLKPLIAKLKEHDTREVLMIAQRRSVEHFGPKAQP
jgi:hypothetical protein